MVRTAVREEARTQRRTSNVPVSGASAMTIANVSVSEGAERLGTRPLSVESVYLLYLSSDGFEESNTYVVECDLQMTESSQHATVLHPKHLNMRVHLA